MAEAPAALYAVTCRYCHEHVVIVPRLREVELTRLRKHLERHRDQYRVSPTGVAAVLDHFSVTPTR